VSTSICYLTDIIRATCFRKCSGVGRDKDIPERFDTVLVHCSDEAQDTGALGYRVARVRAIFRLPQQFNYEHPLAYIEWYSEFEEPHPDTRMYTVHKVKGPGRAAIIHVASIRRSCHLIPMFGEKVNRAWTSEDVLDIASDFYVSDFLDMYTYQFFND